MKAARHVTRDYRNISGRGGRELEFADEVRNEHAWLFGAPSHPEGTVRLTLNGWYHRQGDYWAPIYPPHEEGAVEALSAALAGNLPCKPLSYSLEWIVRLAREVAVEHGWVAKREAIPPKLRTLIYRRDGYACTHCGADDVTRLAIDHRIPVDLGGSNNPSNLRTLCKSCNSEKGARL